MGFPDKRVYSLWLCLVSWTWHIQTFNSWLGWAQTSETTWSYMIMRSKLKPLHCRSLPCQLPAIPSKFVQMIPSSLCSGRPKDPLYTGLLALRPNISIKQLLLSLMSQSSLSASTAQLPPLTPTFWSGVAASPSPRLWGGLVASSPSSTAPT